MVAAFVTVMTACAGGGSDAHPSLSRESDVYLTDALELIEGNALNAPGVDWDLISQTAFELAKGAATPAATYTSIRYAIAALHDHHSFFLPPPQEGEKPAAPPPRNTFRPRQVTRRVGYVWVPGFEGTEADQQEAFAAALQAAIAQIDDQSICAWVVDLSDNTGGNMWPMLAGLAPILGPGNVGSFESPNGTAVEWVVGPGRAELDGTALVSLDAPYQLKRPDPAVAILIGRATASSGEAVALAFRGRPDTRLFGEPTAGLTTANQGFELSDGAALILATAVMADRNGHKGGIDVTILPDEPVADTEQPGAAARWLLTQPPCVRRTEPVSADG